jgi:hypothetical protein
MREGDYFKPGEAIVQSGIYNVIHDAAHLADHQVTCMFGKRFPECNGCGDAVRFTLLHYAKDVDSEACFEAESSEAAR